MKPSLQETRILLMVPHLQEPMLVQLSLKTKSTYSVDTEVSTMLEQPSMTSTALTQLPTHGKRFNMLTTPLNLEVVTQSLLFLMETRDTSTSMEDGTQKASTRTQSDLTQTLECGMIQTSTTILPDGTTQPLWLKPYLHGNISYLEVKLANFKKEVLETLDSAPTRCAFQILSTLEMKKGKI